MFQTSNLPGQFRDRQGTKRKVEAWDSLGGKFATCSSANDLPMLVCVEKANPPVYAVEWMTISVEAGANG